MTHMREKKSSSVPSEPPWFKINCGFYISFAFMYEGSKAR